MIWFLGILKEACTRESHKDLSIFIHLDLQLKMSFWKLCIWIIALTNLSTAFAQNVYVALPNTVRMGVNTTIAISVDGTNEAQEFEIYIEDHPGRRKKLFHNVETVFPNNPKITTVQITASDIPDFIFDDPSVRNYVSLTVRNKVFHKNVTLPVTYKIGYIFLQTDKPIYTPKQRVNFRIIPLNDDGKPSAEKIKLQIRNPKNIVVLENEFSGKTFISPEPYKFPSYPLLGTWTASVLYGHQFLQNSTVRFELQEYVLPTFTVKLRTQEVILPSDKSIHITVEAKFVYGKPVEGTVSLKLGVKGETPEVVFFAVINGGQLVNGIHKATIESSELKDHKSVGWFPEIEGSRFVVEATVTDSATGQKEFLVDASGHFSASPFLISFKRCLNVFKPGLVSIIEADINYVDGRPASRVETTISAKANGTYLKVTNPISISDEHGRVLFEIHPEIDNTEVFITVQSNDPRFEGRQSVGHYTQYNFKSTNKAYIAITRNNKEIPKAGSIFTELVYVEPESMSKIYFMVISKGKIILIKNLPHGIYKLHRIEFNVTQEMVPSFRLLAFAEYNGELITDSVRFDVAKACDPKAEVNLTLDFRSKQPGSNGKIIIGGSKSTVVGLLAVDSAVYALADKDRLTKNKMFMEMERHDLGCGPGGGLTTNSVLRNAGIIMITNNFSPDSLATVSACEERARKKREIIITKGNQYVGRLQQCCHLGLRNDEYERSCNIRAKIVKKYLAENDGNCSEVFLECCLHGEAQTKLQPLAVARAGTSDSDWDILFHQEAVIENGAQVRSDFRETWLFDDIIIGPDGKEEFLVSLPHSITTWVIQAISVSQSYGMCVIQPQNLESFKETFLQLNLPYSVVRNEQIEIRATLFNYVDKPLPAVVYMHGVKDLCTGVEEGEKSEQKRVRVPPHSAETISFPLIPLLEGEYDIKVTALGAHGSDVIIKKLHVKTEGETIERDIAVKLDPTNQQKRSKRHITTDAYSDSIDNSQNLQVTAIRLELPENYIQGTESCTVQALGDQFGPTVQTSLDNPEKLLDKPRGCAEQAMVYLAPTMYTMKYLKSNNRISADTEMKGYSLIREGYDLVLTYRKDDGSYGAWINTPSSTWLTAFIIKVFCQASLLVHIDETVMCSGLKWLISKQQEDGSFVEYHPIYHTEMMGGVQGQVPLTAFVLITLEECSCDIPQLHLRKAQAMSYLEDHLGDITEPLPLAITTYALSLTGSELTEAVDDKLMTLSLYNEDENTLYWNTGSSAYDVEVSGYALLSQLKQFKMHKSNSIVNWLNTKQMSTGSFKSTQDTVVALHALSEYSIRSRMPGLNLVSNITSNNDRNLHKTFAFEEKNALILQEYKVDKLGGMLFVNTAGHGVGLLSVKLRYNVPTAPSKKLCKYHILVNVTEETEEGQQLNHSQNSSIEQFPDDLIRGIKEELDKAPEDALLAVNPRSRPSNDLVKLHPEDRRLRIKREDNRHNSNLVLRLNICTQYLGDRETGMVIIDAGIFTGFIINEDDLKELIKLPEHEIERYELSSRGVVFYLRKVPLQQPYCFRFRIIRDYDVKNLQSSVIKVYSYYSPDESCSIFYNPDKSSPMLRKICSGNICQCAEGGCPPQRPFKNTGITREQLKKTACADHDYVWIVQVMEPVVKENGFLHIKFRVQEVLKQGIEEASLLQNEMRAFLANDGCASAELVPHKDYLIMGKDGKKYLSDTGEIMYRYVLDKTTKIHPFTKNPSKENVVIRRLNWLRKQLKEGCDL